MFEILLNILIICGIILVSLIAIFLFIIIIFTIIYSIKIIKEKLEEEAGGGMANERNLIPFTSNQNREEAKKNGSKGGKKSGEVRRQKKAMKETMKMLLSLDMPECDGKEELKQLG